VADLWDGMGLEGGLLESSIIYTDSVTAQLVEMKSTAQPAAVSSVDLLLHNASMVYHLHVWVKLLKFYE